MSSPSPDKSPSPADIFVHWLERREQGGEQEFKNLLHEHAAHAAELKRIYAEWERALNALAQARAQGNDGDVSLSKRLEVRFGEDVDPHVSLRGSDEREDSISSAVIQRLSARTSSFGRYQLKGEIARGGMGAILRIWDEDLRRHLAMKVILGQADAPSTTATPPIESSKVARFLEEAQVTGQLDHPGIVPVHELGLDPDGRVYFTMKLVNGHTLKYVFDLVGADKEGWTQTKALGVLLKVCEAMAYAHDKGVIHRDLKPGNIMVGKFGEVHVMDWGLARILDKQDEKDIRIREEVPQGTSSLRTEREEHRGETPESPLYTMDGDVVGTPAYMPPEQAAGRVNEVGPHSDVYAMGAMLYHLIAGHMPYVPKDARLNNYAIWGLVQQGAPTSIAQLSPETPAELVAICDKAMARDWKQRYRDMSELAVDLSAYLEHRVVGAYQTGAWAETKKWVERNKPLAASLAAAILLLIGGIVTSMTFARRETEKANALANANTTIQKQNTDLAATTKVAQDNEALAKQKAHEAEEERKTATQKANDVLSLSAIQELKELVERADALWPAFPEKVGEYDRWLMNAKVLIDGRAADPAHGVERHPSLKDHEATLAEIRKRAKPLTPEEIEADRRASPSFAEWERSRAKLTWMQRMLGAEPWPREADIEAALAKENLPADAKGLNDIAWPLVDPDPSKAVYGSEIRALLLARRAVAASKDTERAEKRDTLAWALFKTARFDEAFTEEKHALSEVEDSKKKEYEDYVAKLERAISDWQGDGARTKQAEAAAKLAAPVADLERSVNERRTYEFDDPHDRWWNAQLSQLVMDLRAFTDEKTGLYSECTSKEHGWGIVKRRKEAATIEERTLNCAEAKQRWDEAIAAIAKSPKYGGLKLTPQIGLLPVGEDPDSHLWEFAHLQTGEPAQRGAHGKLLVTEKMGLVFVLIPAGKFWMGAQKTDLSGHNYDPLARDNESPVHEVPLSAYFISKYEMTQGQWQTFAGNNPSYYGPSSNPNGYKHDLRHPVENVSWLDCMTVMSRLGLSLPSEAQWENGCRGGTDTAWWTGTDRESLRGIVNLADQSFVRAGGQKSIADEWSDLDDGWVVHAPVGTFVGNAFGLHEVHGNVWEWCLDGYDGNFHANSLKLDPVAPWAGASDRVTRGSSFTNAASDARSARRVSYTPELQNSIFGLRPARASQLATSSLPPQGK